MKIAVVDIGGTSLKYGLWQNDKLVQVQEKVYDAKKGAAYMVSLVEEILTSLLPFNGIGISTAGLIDSENGIVNYASENIPGYTGTNLRQILQQQFNVPVAVENDVNSVAIAEAVYGAGADYNNFICLAYGTGIGGAIIKDKAILHHGTNFAAGEMGYIVTHANERKPYNDQSGVYESYASTTALVKKAMAYDDSLTSGRKIFSRLNEAKVQEIIDEWLVEVAIGLGSLIHVFDPPCVVLGGGIMNQDYVINKLTFLLPMYTMPLYHNVVLRPAKLGNNTAMLGAGYLAKKLYEGTNL